MRIIGGKHRGRVLKVPKGLPVRPTTDFAKEALFNILANRVDLEETNVLDLFSGTGHISLEFSSRGCKSVVAVDQHFKCVAFLRETAESLKLPVTTVKGDVFKFLENSRGSFDLIFADPPYDLANIQDIYDLVFRNNLLNESGLMIIEHGAGTSFAELPYFNEHRKYGNVNFTFFKKGQ